MAWPQNTRLAKSLQERFIELHDAIELTLETIPCRRFEDFTYRTQKSWRRLRRVVGTAEVLEKGEHPMYIVVNLPKKGFKDDGGKRFRGTELYEFHGQNVAILAHGLTKEKEVPRKEIERAIGRKICFENAPEAHTYQEDIV